MGNTVSMQFQISEVIISAAKLQEISERITRLENDLAAGDAQLAQRTKERDEARRMVRAALYTIQENAPHVKPTLLSDAVRRWDAEPVLYGFIETA